jgi:hypothetical protein
MFIVDQFGGVTEYVNSRLVVQEDDVSEIQPTGSRYWSPECPPSTTLEHQSWNT